MKLMLVAAMLLFPFASRSQTFTTAQAREHEGEKVTICGTVASEHVARSSKGQPTFIDLDSAYPNQVFVVIVWEEDRQQVGTLPAVKSHLCTTGVVRYFHGVPQMVVRRNSQFSH